MDEQGFRLWGMSWTATTISGELPACIPPADSDRVKSAFAASRAADVSGTCYRTQMNG